MDNSKLNKKVFSSFNNQKKLRQALSPNNQSINKNSYDQSQQNSFQQNNISIEQDENDELFKKIKEQQQKTGKSFLECLDFNQHYELYKNIDFDQIFQYILDKGRRLKQMISDQLLTKEVIETLKNSIHFQSQIQKAIQELILNQRLNTQVNNWNLDNVKEIENYFLDWVDRIIKEQELSDQYNKKFHEYQLHCRRHITQLQKVQDQYKDYFKNINK